MIATGLFVPKGITTKNSKLAQKDLQNALPHHHPPSPPLRLAVKHDQTSKQASQSSCISCSPSLIMFCEQKMTSSSCISAWKKLSSSCSVGSSSMRKKACSILRETSSFSSIVIGDSSSISSSAIASPGGLPMNKWYISSCFLAAFCMACKWRAKADDRRAPGPPKLIVWMCVGERQSSCSTCTLRSDGRQFSCSLSRKGLGISGSCSLETLRLETLRVFRAKRGARPSGSSGELLKLCILKTEDQIQKAKSYLPLLKQPSPPRSRPRPPPIPSFQPKMGTRSFKFGSEDGEFQERYLLRGDSGVGAAGGGGVQLPPLVFI